MEAKTTKIDKEKQVQVLSKAISANGVLNVKILPNSSNNEIVDLMSDNLTLKIKIKAKPENFKANDELIKYLSKSLNTPISHITIIKGKTSSKKTLKITHN